MGWFTRKTRPSRAASNERYGGRPLLIVLENYVLSTIEPLSPEKETESLTILQQLYGGGSNWRAILRTRFQISDYMDESLRQMWTSDQERAQQERRAFAAFGLDHSVERLQPLPGLDRIGVLRHDAPVAGK